MASSSFVYKSRRLTRSDSVVFFQGKEFIPSGFGTRGDMASVRLFKAEDGSKCIVKNNFYESKIHLENESHFTKRFLGACENDGENCLVMPLIQGDTYYHYPFANDKDRILAMIAVIDTLIQLNTKENVVHNDPHMKNVMVNKERGDFKAKFIDYTFTTEIGKPMIPRIGRMDEPTKIASSRTDVDYLYDSGTIYNFVKELKQVSNADRNKIWSLAEAKAPLEELRKELLEITKSPPALEMEGAGLKLHSGKVLLWSFDKETDISSGDEQRPNNIFRP